MGKLVLAVLAGFACALGGIAATAADIELKPPTGGSVVLKTTAGNFTRFRVSDEGDVSLFGSILKNGAPFIHDTSPNSLFIGLSAGNVATGVDNTGVGYFALRDNTTGHSNTVAGRAAMLFNTTGYENTAHGANALHDNTEGYGNVAVGNDALFNNTTGYSNTANGDAALYFNTTGFLNTAVGSVALHDNTAGDRNVAVGYFALFNNLTGSRNTVVGTGAGQQITGSDNIVIGSGAGVNTHGERNIVIGHGGDVGDDATIRLGSGFIERTFIAGIRGKTTGFASTVPVVIDSQNQLGTISSSATTKDDIADMADATDDLMKLRPVTFHYKADQDPAGRTLQYGLVAEEVAEVYPGLVAHSPDGKVETVMYQFLPSMLLNEVQKQRRTIEALEAKLAAIEKRIGTQGEQR